MSTRRNFFKVLGLGAGVAVGGAAAVAAILPNKVKEKTIKDIENSEYPNKLTIGATYGEKAHLQTTDGFIVSTRPHYIPGTRKDVTASITVGPDGEMYLNTNGKWRRIVTE